MVANTLDSPTSSPSVDQNDPSEAAVALSVVVACFDKEDMLREALSRVVSACKDAAGDSFEIIFLDDGSTDKSRALLRQFVAENYHVSAVLLTRNHGQRTMRKEETQLKRASASLFYRVFDALIDMDMPYDAGDFRLISRRALTALLSMPEQHRFIRGMTSWLGFSQAPFPYERDERFAGESKYPFRKMVQFALDGITSFSIAPLRFASILGLLSALGSLLVTLYAPVSWLSGSVVPGWTSIIVVVLMLGGVQMLIIGIMGEYVGRTYIEVKRRPLFVVDEVLGERPAKRK